MLKLKFKENHAVTVLDNGVRILSDDIGVMCIVDPRSHDVFLPMSAFTDENAKTISIFLLHNGIHVNQESFGDFMMSNTSFGYGLTNGRIIPKGEDPIVYEFSDLVTAVANFSI